MDSDRCPFPDSILSKSPQYYPRNKRDVSPSLPDFVLGRVFLQPQIFVLVL
jgi:hypothetical protein